MRTDKDIADVIRALKERYRLWQCDDGTYDVVDTREEDDRYAIAYQNLGTPGDEQSAWVALVYRLINDGTRL